MKFSELFEDYMPDDLQDILADYLLAIKARGIREIEMGFFIRDIKDKFHLDVEPEDMQGILSKIPLVKDSTANMIYLEQPDRTQNKPPNAKQAVSKMASKAADKASNEEL